MYHVHTHMTNLHLQHYMSQHWDTTKPGLWTLDWTMDWTLDSIMDSIIGLDFQSSGVKGYSAAKL